MLSRLTLAVILLKQICESSFRDVVGSRVYADTRHSFTSFDFGPVYNEVRGSYDNLEKWARPQNIDFNISWFAMGPKMQLEPKGVVLIIAPFNLPILLTLSPLVRNWFGEPFAHQADSTVKVRAIAAGNAVCIKPSEQNPTVNALLTELLPKYLDTDLYHVINGGVAETTQVRYDWTLCAATCPW